MGTEHVYYQVMHVQVPRIEKRSASTRISQHSSRKRRARALRLKGFQYLQAHLDDPVRVDTLEALTAAIEKHLLGKCNRSNLISVWRGTSQPHELPALDYITAKLWLQDQDNAEKLFGIGRRRLKDRLDA